MSIRHYVKVCRTGAIKIRCTCKYETRFLYVVMVLRVRSMCEEDGVTVGETVRVFHWLTWRWSTCSYKARSVNSLPLWGIPFVPWLNNTRRWKVGVVCSAIFLALFDMNAHPKISLKHNIEIIVWYTIEEMCREVIQVSESGVNEIEKGLWKKEKIVQIEEDVVFVTMHVFGKLVS